jgi:ABC-type transport system substrate-binding protein
VCPDEPDHAKVYVRGERIKKAYEILREAGYTWETPPVSGDGEVTEGEGLKHPDGTPVADFSILTPPADYDPNRAMAGLMIQEWLRKAGIPASAKPMGFSSLLQQVKTRHEFDMFVLGYGSLSLDPDYLRAFFHSSQDKPRGWNMGGYRNPEYDQLAEKQAGTMDAGKRREIIWEMQRVLMHDVPYLPLYNPKMVEGVRNDRFGGWVQMVEGIGNTWSFCTIKPK